MISETAVVEGARVINSTDFSGFPDPSFRTARAVLEAAAPHMLFDMNSRLDAVRALHAEDLFRGHLSNGCRTCGPVGDIGYPCPTILALD